MLRTIDLSLAIGERMLLSRLNWSINPGECWCVIGANGSGKSTLLRALAGLRTPNSGTIELKGQDLQNWDAGALARERSYLPQGRHDAFGYTVLETLLTARHPYQHAHYWESDADHAIAHAALEKVDAVRLKERDIRTLSGGERQRVAIATVLVQDTPLILLDEPANALDLAHQVGTMRLISQLCSEQKKAVVLVSHDLNMAHGASTHALLILGDGAWVAGTVDDIMQPALLSQCLGHPIEVMQQGKRTIYIPVEDDSDE